MPREVVTSRPIGPRSPLPCPTRSRPQLLRNGANSDAGTSMKGRASPWRRDLRVHHRTDQLKDAPHLAPETMRPAAPREPRAPSIRSSGPLHPFGRPAARRRPPRTLRSCPTPLGCATRAGPSHASQRPRTAAEPGSRRLHPIRVKRMSCPRRYGRLPAQRTAASSYPGRAPGGLFGAGPRRRAIARVRGRMAAQARVEGWSGGYTIGGGPLQWDGISHLF